MSQFNLFTGEIEDDTTIIEPEPEIIPPAPPKHVRKGRKDFDIKRCRRCDQLLLNDPNNDRDNGLCESCDPRLSAQYNQFKNIALAKALRAHKQLNRYR